MRPSDLHCDNCKRYYIHVEKYSHLFLCDECRSKMHESLNKRYEQMMAPTKVSTLDLLIATVRKFCGEK